MSKSQFESRGPMCAIGALCLIAIAMVQMAPAETQIQYFTTFSDNGTVPQVCLREGSIVRNEIYLYDHPDQWRWIVVCDELAWERVEKHLGRQSDGRGVYLALTQFDQGLTYIRGDAVLHPISDALEMQVDHTIRHELGHILLKSGNCETVERYARAMLDRLHAEQAIFAENERMAKNRTMAAGKERTEE